MLTTVLSINSYCALYRHRFRDDIWADDRLSFRVMLWGEGVFCCLNMFSGFFGNLVLLILACVLRFNETGTVIFENSDALSAMPISGTLLTVWIAFSFSAIGLSILSVCILWKTRYG